MANGSEYVMEHCENRKSESIRDWISTELFAGNVIGTFARALTDKVEQSVCDVTGLSRSACYAIVTVGSEPGSSIESLRKMLALEHSSLVRLLKRLEGYGLLERVRGAGADQRIVEIYLTNAGEACFTKILDARRAVLDEVLESLEVKERDDMVKLIAKVMPKVVKAGDDQHYVCRLCDLEVCPQEVCPVNLAYPEFFELPNEPFRRKVTSQ